MTRIDKLKFKQQDQIWICPNCNTHLPKSVGKMNHLEKCRSKENKRK